MGVLYVYMGWSDVYAILWNVTYIYIRWLLSIYYTCLEGFCQTEQVSYKKSAYHDFMHYAWLVQVFVLVPYVLSISKGVGCIWEEY